MKYLAVLFFSVFFFALSAEDVEPVIGDEVVISVQNQFIYPRPAFYASPVQPVDYGTLATIDDISGEWFNVTTAGGREGWIHRTAVSGALQSSGDVTASGEVTSDEIMLAGRGFSQEIENAYSSEHPDLDFTKVDYVETMYPVSPEELLHFLLTGNLIEEEATR